MATGMRIRHPVTGALKMDLTTRLPRLLGTVDTTVNNGAIAIPNLGTGTGWFAATPLYGDGVVWGGNTPTITMSGSTLSWTFAGSQDPGNRAVRVVYGVY